MKQNIRMNGRRIKNFFLFVNVNGLFNLMKQKRVRLCVNIESSSFFD